MLAELGEARVEVARGRRADAIDRLRALTRRLPVTGAIALLGDLQEQAGHRVAATRSFELVRTIGQLQQSSGQVTDLEMAIFEADHADDAVSSAHAVELARRAYEARPDNVFVNDALAWSRTGRATPGAPLHRPPPARYPARCPLPRRRGADAGARQGVRDEIGGVRQPWFSVRYHDQAQALAETRSEAMSAIARLVVLGARSAVLLTPASRRHPRQLHRQHVRRSRVGADCVDVDFVVDMAESRRSKPSDIDRNGDDEIAPAEAARYAKSRCSEMTKGLRLVVDGAALALHRGASAATLPIGQAGLATLRLECQYNAAVSSADTHTLSFANRNLGDRVGWHEVTAVGAGAVLHRATFRHARWLAQLAVPGPAAPVTADVRTAQVEFREVARNGRWRRPRSNADRVGRRGVDDLTQSFTSSVAARNLTVGLALVALAIGVVSARSAFAPGTQDRDGCLSRGERSTVLTASSSASPSRRTPWGC